MYVSRLYLKNYRSIKELDLVFHKGKNVIIGRNNCGKSNIVRALDIVLGETSPTYAKAENITSGDFHTWRETQAGHVVTHNAGELLIWCELTRDNHEQLNWDELYKCYGFYRCCAGSRFGPAQRFDPALLPTEYEEIFGIGEDECQEKKYINPKLRHQRTLEDEFGGMYRFALAFKATRTGDRITKELRLLYREDDETGWIMAFKASARTELLQSAIIPSFRDPQQQLRLSSWTWYGKLMQHLTANHAQMPALETAFASVHAVANDIFAGVREQITRSTLAVAFPGTQLFFQLNPDTQLELYKSCLIYVDDGFKSLLTEKGSGIQSATIIGLFTYYTQHVNTVTGALLCIEEPEVYLHPHARRVVSARLNDFLGERNQVILTTHSAEFLRSSGEDIHVIAVQHCAARGTTSVAVDLKEYASVLINDAANELFFADKVIVCEGFDDFIVRATANAAFPNQLDERNVSVVSVGGKNNISKLVKLVLKLGLACYVVADFDYFLRDAGAERRPYDAKPHESIVSLGTAFFSQACTFGDEGPAILAGIMRMRSVIKRDEEQAFYTATTADEIATPGLSALLERLRERGVCILSGNIEDLCADATFSAQKKLSLERIFFLNQRLIDGEQITDIFASDDLLPSLAHILQA